MENTAPILLVDDDADIRDALVDVLEMNGFSVVGAANGQEALHVLSQMPSLPSVILLDLMMPVMDGYEFFKEQKKNPAFAGIPVAVITAAHGVDRDRFGGHAPVVLPKPIKVPQLLETVRQLQSHGERRA